MRLSTQIRENSPFWKRLRRSLVVVNRLHKTKISTRQTMILHLPTYSRAQSPLQVTLVNRCAARAIHSRSHRQSASAQSSTLASWTWAGSQTRMPLALSWTSWSSSMRTMSSTKTKGLCPLRCLPRAVRALELSAYSETKKPKIDGQLFKYDQERV